MKGSQNTIGCMRTIGINLVVPVGTDHSFIGKDPQETACSPWIVPHQFPEVVQSGPESAIVQSVEKFGREDDFMSMPVGAGAIIIVDIMLRISAVEFFPGMNDNTFLNIVFGKKRIKIRIVPAFVAIIPNNDRRMIDIPDYHLLYQPCPGKGIILIVPACQFIQNKEPE